MTAFTDEYWQSEDGLRLHYRDYAGPPDRPPLVCLPGLTRNARDFAGLAQRLAGEWRVLCPDMRGRGGSAIAPDPLTYTARQYLADVTALLGQLGIARFVAIGTSLGGLMTMALAKLCPQRIAGALLNDIGPVIEPAGLAQIGTYLGLDQRYQDWDAAAASLQASFKRSFPDRDAAGWIAFARRLLVRTDDGRLRFDYDPRIAVTFGHQAGALPDLWPGLDALAGAPLLIVRGELSDILSAATFAEMQARAPGCEAVTLPRIGHCPELDEPEALAAIGRLLDRVA